MESKDEEVRKRAESLIPALEIEDALLPKRVTLKVTDAPIGTVLGEFEKQTGMKVATEGKDGGAKVTLAAAGVPFWEALDEVGKATGRGPAMQGYPVSLHLVPNARRSPFVNVRGPFRLEATWFHEDRDVDLTEAKSGGGGPRHHGLTMAVSVLAEPRLTLLKVLPAKVEEAVDSDGKSLLEPADPAQAGIANYPTRGTFRGEHLHSSDVRLRRASETAKTARVIRGTIPVKAVLIRKPVVVGGKLADSAGATVRSGADSLVVTEVQNQGGNNVMVSIRMPADNNGQQREWHDRFRVEDDAGNRYQMNGRGTSSDGRVYTIQMYYAPPFNKKNVGPPSKLIFEDWVIHDHAIPFEFRDVPLP